MEGTIGLSDAARSTAGILLISVVAIEAGGTYLLRLLRGAVPATTFQLAFARAGHAHAGVLVILALASQPFVDAAGATGAMGVIARSGVAVAAILMSAGFFLSSHGSGRTTPNGWIVLVYAGAACLAAGALTLGIALISS